MAKSNKFWDRFANIYAKSKVTDQAAYQYKLETTREYLNKDMLVLEFGCGTGSTAILQAPFAKHVLAQDASAKMLTIARAKATAAAIDNVTFQHSTIEDFDAGGQEFDMVMGHSILHLVAGKEAVIAKVYDLLTPGGVFVSSTMCLGRGFHPLKLFLPAGNFLGLLPPVNFFDAEDLLASLTSAGFEIAHTWQSGREAAQFAIARRPA